MSELNTQIKEAIDSFDITKARELLRDALKEPDAETYYLASSVAVDDDQKVDFLKKALELDPFYQDANDELERLEISIPATQTVQPVSTPVSVPTTDLTSTPSPAPIAAPSANLSDVKNKLVTGRVTGTDAKLYKTPIDVDVELRSTLPLDAELTVVERDDFAGFFRVLYKSPTGMIYGWVLAEKVSKPVVGKQEINPMDLPVTNFDWASRDDVRRYIQLRSAWLKPFESKANKANFNWDGQGLQFAFRMGLFFGGLFLFGGVIMLFDSSGDYDNPVLNGIISIIIGIGLLTALWRLLLPRVKAKLTQRDAHTAEANEALKDAQRYTSQMKRLEPLKLSLPAQYENLSDEQRRDGLIQFAVTQAQSR